MGVLTEALWNKGSALEALLERVRQPRSRRIEKPPKLREYQKRLSAAERAEVARRYVAGEAMGGLASSFGCHRDAIRRALKREGVALRNWRTKVAGPARVVEL